ncbi:hypothetical protein NOF04DRAFT_1269796 [Fusarium oxysporum II5]|nr:hypothetical protein NOF04DRAFT_1269796 [Fusarium oxysporum II5]
MPDGRDLEVKLEQEETVPSWDDEDQRVDADFRSVAGKMQLPKLVRYAVEAGEERKSVQQSADKKNRDAKIRQQGTVQRVGTGVKPINGVAIVASHLPIVSTIEPQTKT